MINTQLIKPSSIAIIGASNNLKKPGGGLVKNLLEGGFKGNIYPVNPKEKEIQGLKVYNTILKLPDTDLAILALSAELCVPAVEDLSKKKNTKAFIIISAGFSEMGNEGKKLEQQLKEIARKKNLSIIGPNCIGVMNTSYTAIFVSPPPIIVKQGVDFVSASGALAVFLFETAAKHGLKFSNVFTVGNSANTGVEEVLAYWDKEFNADTSSKVKMVYVEQIRKPHLFFKHISSLRRKGCHVIVVKPGESEAGARAALSHTGALAGDSEAFNLLIKKSGAILCKSRDELIHIACILQQKKLDGKNIAIITHAGGPAVMLSDRLQEAGINIPEIDNNTRKKLIDILHPGSSALNPIDMLATANRDQLSAAIKICSNLNYINGIIVIYGKTGMEDLFQTYKALSESVDSSPVPVYTIMPSINSGEEEISKFIKNRKTTFFDEVVFANALDKVIHEPKEYGAELFIPIPNNINLEPKALNEEKTYECLKWAGILYVHSELVNLESDLSRCKGLNFPLVAKVNGVLHKTEVDGIVLNINNEEELKKAFKKLSEIPNSKGILVQEMLSGKELYLGAKMHEGIGYSVHAGFGGIFLELTRDISSSLAPIEIEEALFMLSQLKSKKIFEGYRNMPAINKIAFAQIIRSFSNIFKQYPNIREIDLNPLIATDDEIIAVDARIIT